MGAGGKWSVGAGTLAEQPKEEKCGGGLWMLREKVHELARVLVVREHEVDSRGSRFPWTEVED